MENREPSHNINYPTSMYWLLKDELGTKSIRALLNKEEKTKTIGQQKWSNEVALDDEYDWKRMFLMATKCNVNARIKYFNYQILQRSLVTNRKPYIFKLIDSEKCDNYKCNVTITHHIYEVHTI